MAHDLLRAVALRYRAAGLCVLPAHAQRKCPALSRWAPYQSQLPEVQQVTGWFAGAHDGLCLVCGAVSGNLELLDFDLGGEAFQAWWDRVAAAAPQLLNRLVVEQSPSGGWHVVYRCEEPVCGNMKLAQRKQLATGPDEVTIAGKSYRPRQDAQGRWNVSLTLIETRGEGGIFLCAPTTGYELLQGDFTDLPVLTAGERETLLEAAWALNESVAEVVSGPAPSEPTDCRPGDDFGQRGDVRAVLRQHGWTLARAGDNEHWRRPGKTSGTSATLKDNVFYVFSSSAAPFEPNRGYSPFAVYTLLEHGGDYAAAAAALRQLGFGGDVRSAGDVDLSRLMPVDDDEDDDGPVIENPGSIPDSLMRVPGFVGEIMDFSLYAARYPSVPLAFCGAMALQSFLCSRKVREQGGLRPNLYLLALAGSGTGKAYPRKVNSYILGRVGLGGAVGNQIASGQGLEDEMFAHHKMLFQTDEVDHLLRCLSSSKESYHSMLLAMLLQLYTEADETHSMRTKAKGKGHGHEIRGEIDQPGLVIFGTATPECFYESLSPRLLTNGLFSRAIVVDATQRSGRQQARDVSELPEHLIECAQWWKDYNPTPVNPTTGRKANLDEEHPIPAIVPYGGQGEALLDAFAARADDEYDAAIKGGDQVRAVLWTRASENAMRLALVYACSRDHLSPAIDDDAARWATQFVDHLVRRMLFMAELHVSDSDFERRCKLLLEVLHAWQSQNADPWMPYCDITRRLRWSRREHDDVRNALLDQERIKTDMQQTRGRPRLVYRALIRRVNA